MKKHPSIQNAQAFAAGADELTDHLTAAQQEGAVEFGLRAVEVINLCYRHNPEAMAEVMAASMKATGASAARVAGIAARHKDNPELAVRIIIDVMRAQVEATNAVDIEAIEARHTALS